MSTVHVQPIVTPEINWANLLHILKHAKGRDCSKAKSSRGMHEYAAFIATLEDMVDVVDPPVFQVSKAQFSLEMLQFGYLVTGTDRDLVALLETDLHVRTTKSVRDNLNLAYVSGSLRAWRDAICERERYATTGAREILNDVHQHLETVGFRGLFLSYRRVDMKDGTYLLEAKDK